MAVTIKAYFEKPGLETEIRRFAFEPGTAASYNKLAGQLIQVFASLQGKTFNLYWKDEDNDSIAFSSDQELTEALSFLKGGVFRVYIKPQDLQSGSSTGVVHPHVTCDVCESPVCGTRYKCVVCPDYDLCSGCQGKGLHTEHDMMAIRTPQSGWNPAFAMFHPQGRPHCGPPGPPGPHGPHGPHGDPSQWGQMRRAWRRWWRQMMSQNPEGNQQEAKSDKDENANGKAKSETKPATETKAETSDGSDSQSEEYLKNVGESVAQMLDPLGIDVEVDVEHKQRRKRCGRQGHPPPPFNQWGPWGWGWGHRGHGGHGGRGGHGRGRGCWWTECPTDDQSQQKANQEEKPAQKPEQKPGQKPEQKPEQQKPDVDMKETSAETGEPQNSSGAAAGPATSNTMSDGSPGNRSSPEDEWTLLGKDKPENMDTTSTDGATPPGGKLYPEIPPAHTDPVIAGALEQMYSMGFNNEGGWLTNLVEAMEGDINKVLDTIRPQRPPQ